MGESKRRKTNDPFYGKPVFLGGRLVKDRRILRPSFYDARLKTASFVTRRSVALPTSNGTLPDENGGSLEVLNEDRVLELRSMIPPGAFDRLSGDTVAEIFWSILSDPMKASIEQSQLGEILLFLLLSSIQESSNSGGLSKHIIPKLASACACPITKVDLEAICYIRGLLRLGQAEPQAESGDLSVMLRLFDCVDVLENIGSDRVVYRDSNLAITWFADSSVGSGELLISIKDPDGIWSFEKWDGLTMPLSSLKQAKQAITEYRMSCCVNRKGEITHSYSERLAKFLGLSVREGFAFVN